jgi:2',3'-cyclic-nucleotide 2'-phosphodiesterase (5'-nucleotidase family)
MRRTLVFLRLVAIFAAVSIHVSCMPTAPGVDLDLSGQQVRLTFLQTSDIHSRLLPYDFSPLKTDTDLGLIPEMGPFGGATRMASILKQQRAKSERAMHIDTGDSFQGAPIFNVNLGEVEYKFLSLVGLNAAALGNHEFDAGAANFTKQARDNAKFPVMAANYVWEDPSQDNSNGTAFYTSPYTIQNIGGLRVGVIGMGNISSLASLVERGNSIQAIPLEQNEVARNYVDLIRPTVDVIVITSHQGLTEDQELVEGYQAYYQWKVAEPFVNRASGPKWQVLEWFGPEGDPASVVSVQIPGVEGIDVLLGGHLHIVLNPPQLLTDPSGRKVILSHGGAFSKYVIRLDTVIQMPKAGESKAEGGEVISHDFKVLPIDALWCSPGLHDYYKSQFWNPGDFPKDAKVQQGIKDCTAQEDLATAQLLSPYISALDYKLNLTSTFAYAPANIERRNNSTGGDSPLGNITADSMRRRQGVEAEVGLTNTLGIRDNLYAGLLNQEDMFNVFPFENTINIMFLSGREMQELFDFVTEKSAGRGCAAQAQISGARFTMDCAQSQLNALLLACNPANGVADCPNDDRTGRAPWQCIADTTLTQGGRCFAHDGTNITITGKPLVETETYRIAVNDYIARGGSGFLVLKRNTTRIETGIPLRDSLIGYMQNFCTCDELLANNVDTLGNVVGKLNQPCGTRDPAKDSHWIVDPLSMAQCAAAADFHTQLNATVAGSTCSCQQIFRREPACGTAAQLDTAVQSCLTTLPAGPPLGRCGCRDALGGSIVCGNVTRQTRNFCENPTALPIAIGTEDGRIARRVK